MRIEKKTWPDMFQKVLDGDKNFDLRVADFAVEEGDTLVLREFDPNTGEYTGRQIERKITFVLKTQDVPFYSQEDIARHGFVVMALSQED